MTGKGLRMINHKYFKKSVTSSVLNGSPPRTAPFARRKNFGWVSAAGDGGVSALGDHTAFHVSRRFGLCRSHLL